MLPRTTLLEHEHNQEKLQQGVIANIGAAIKLLTYHGVALPEINARELVPPMISFLHLRATGVQLEVENPKLEDYRNCLHLSPQPPETKSDEMRDLVIWEVALRVAKRDGKAILVSRDHVHSDERGEAAEACGLLRVQSLDDFVVSGFVKID